MPLCFCYTNLNSSDIPEGFELRLSKCLAEVLSKPEKYILVTVQPGLRMCRSGSTDSCLVCQIHSIGVFDETRNTQYTPKIFDFLLKELSVSESRISIEYIDVPPHMGVSRS